MYWWCALLGVVLCVACCVSVVDLCVWNLCCCCLFGVRGCVMFMCGLLLCSDVFVLYCVVLLCVFVLLWLVCVGCVVVLCLLCFVWCVALCFCCCDYWCCVLSCGVLWFVWVGVSCMVLI